MEGVSCEILEWMTGNTDECVVINKKLLTFIEFLLYAGHCAKILHLLFNLTLFILWGFLFFISS